MDNERISKTLACVVVYSVFTAGVGSILACLFGFGYVVGSAVRYLL